MRIEKYISELLYEHDCVIIPGFGGLVCNYSSAQIQAGKNQFHPPFKKISFNRNLKNNDGLLAHQITQSEKISYSDSIGLITEYVEKLNKALISNNRFDLKDIGTFYTGEENTILFEQNKTVNYLTDAFGLSIFCSPPVKRDPIEGIHALGKRKTERKLKDKIIIPSKDSKEFVPVKIRVRQIRYLIAFAAVLLIALSLWIPIRSGWLSSIDYSTLNFFVRQIGRTNAFFGAAKEKHLYRFSETIPEQIRGNNQKENSSNDFTNDTLSYITVFPDGKTPVVVRLSEDAPVVIVTPHRHRKNKIKQSSKRFYIIGGAFAVSENAKRLKNKLINQGFRSIIIRKKNSALQFVAYESYAIRNEAISSLNKIRVAQNDVWLMAN